MIDVDDFRFVRELVHARCAVRIEAGQEYLVESRLGPVAAEEGMEDVPSLVRSLRRGANPALVQRVVDAMTTHETSFFRDPTLFEFVRRRLLPELVERRRAERKLAIWSAAAASGQEVYSIAMLLRESFPEVSGWDVRLIASDVSRAVLDRARAGVYSQFEVNRGLPASLLVKHFRQRGAEWEISSELRAMVEFVELNLADSAWSVPPVDVVFLRNVLIYFDVATKRSVLGNVRRVLRPHGAVVLGGAESAGHVDEAFVPVDPRAGPCYRVRLT